MDLASNEMQQSCNMIDSNACFILMLQRVGKASIGCSQVSHLLKASQ